MATNLLAREIVKRTCMQDSSPWVTSSQIEEYTKKNGGNIIDIRTAAREGKVLYKNGLFTTLEINKAENTIVDEMLRIAYEYELVQVEERAIYKLISDYEELHAPIKLDGLQKKAVVYAVNNRVSILTGGPGTGKTTVISCIAYVLRRVHKTIGIVFSAPTAMAASRLSDATNEDAITVQKYFGITPNGMIKNSFFQDVLFIDESSFLDMNTLALVVQNIGSKTRLILSGDPYQLPSVGIGKCFLDICESKVFPTVNLTKTFRQDESSLLFRNIKLVKQGKIELEKGTDFHPMQISKDEDPVEIQKKIVQTYYSAVKHKGIDNVRLIIPTNNTFIGTKNMNKLLQKYINPRTDGFSCTVDGEKVFYKIGDLVMQTTNKEYANNGETGKVVDYTAVSVTVAYKNGEAVYTLDNIDEIELAYAITVHKSQGSEADVVISVCLNEHKKLFNRNFLFTAISRSKKQHVIIYHETALSDCLSKDAYENRHSRLLPKLQMLDAQYALAG